MSDGELAQQFPVNLTFETVERNARQNEGGGPDFNPKNANGSSKSQLESNRINV